MPFLSILDLAIVVEGATPAAYFVGSLAYMSPEQLEACDPAHPRQPEEFDGPTDSVRVPAGSALAVDRRGDLVRRRRVSISGAVHRIVSPDRAAHAGRRRADAGSDRRISRGVSYRRDNVLRRTRRSRRWSGDRAAPFLDRPRPAARADVCGGGGAERQGDAAPRRRGTKAHRMRGDVRRSRFDVRRSSSRFGVRGSTNGERRTANVERQTSNGEPERRTPNAERRTSPSPHRSR